MWSIAELKTTFTHLDQHHLFHYYTRKVSHYWKQTSDQHIKHRSPENQTNITCLHITHEKYRTAENRHLHIRPISFVSLLHTQSIALVKTDIWLCWPTRRNCVHDNGRLNWPIGNVFTTLANCADLHRQIVFTAMTASVDLYKACSVQWQAGLIYTDQLC